MQEKGHQACFTYTPGGNCRLGMLLPRAGSVWKSDRPLDEFMWTSFPNAEVERVVLTQSISEASSHHDIKLCVQNTAEKVNGSWLPRAAFVLLRSNSAEIIWDLKECTYYQVWLERAPPTQRPSEF